MTDIQEIKNFGIEILKNKKSNINDQSKIIFFSLAGSHSFNLNVETSDKDYFGVYATDIDDVLLGDIKEPIIDGHEPEDYVIFEVSNFIELLYKGNPKLIEPVFSNRYCYKSAVWESLMKIKRSFITKSVIYHYISYSKSQMGDATKIIFNNSQSEQPTEDQKTLLLNMINSNHNYHKKLYHTYRLLLETKRMLSNQEPVVYLEGEEREKIMNIRLGKEDITSVLNQVQQLFKECQSLDQSSNNQLPETLDIKSLNDWLIQVRKQSYIQKEALAESTTIKYTDTDFEINDIKNYNLLKVYNHFQSLLEKHHLQDSKILMINRSGSTSHNLLGQDEIDNQDFKLEDWIGVYVAPTENIFSLYPPPRRIDSNTPVAITSRIEEPEDSSNQRDTYYSGLQLFELGYFVNLLSAGNHRAIECIYGADLGDSLETKVWKDIKQLGINYLTVNLAMSCWGISKGLVEKIQKNKDHFPLSEKRKLFYHAQRLINRAEEIVNKSQYTVYLDDDDDKLERELLLQIKNSPDFNSTQLNDLITSCSNKIKTVGDSLQKLQKVSAKDKKLNEINIKESLKSNIIKIRKSMIKITI